MLLRVPLVIECEKLVGHVLVDVRVLDFSDIFSQDRLISLGISGVIFRFSRSFQDSVMAHRQGFLASLDLMHLTFATLRRLDLWARSDMVFVKPMTFLADFGAGLTRLVPISGIVVRVVRGLFGLVLLSFTEARMA